MTRWMLTIVCALSVAAVAGAQDDDWDVLLAGLGDDAIDEAPAAVEVTETAVAEEDPFADLFEEAEAVPEAVEEAADQAAEAVAGAAEEIPEAVEAVGVVEEIPAEAGDSGENWDFDEAFADASEAVEEAAGDVAESVEETADPFADLFEEADGGFDAGPEETVVEETVVEAVEAVPEAVEAAEEEAGEDPFADFFVEEEVAVEAVPAEEVADAVEEEVAEEIAAVEEAIAEADAELATQEEGEAAATIIRNAKKGKGKGKERVAQEGERVRPVEPAVKPQKKDKFSSEARTPLKPKTAVPDWDAPVSMDGSEVVAPVAKPAERAPAARESGDWDEPVVW